MSTNVYSWMILAVFEATGDDLISCCNSMQKYAPLEEVMEDICGLLVKNRVNVSVLDLNFYPYHIGFRGLPNSSFCKFIEDAYDLDNNLTARSTESSFWPSYFYVPSRRTSMSIPKLACLGPQPQLQSIRFYSTGACEAKKISKSLEHTGVSPLPKNLAYITKKIINRFRFL